MCRPLLAVLGGVLLTIGVVSPVYGQNAADYRRRLDSLERRGVVVNRLLQARRISLIERSPRDTIRAGALTVVVARSGHDRAKASVDSAWAVIDSTYGASAAVLRSRTFALKFSGALLVLLPGEIAVDSGNLLNSATFQLSQQVDSGITNWLVGVFTPTPLDRIRWDLLYVALAATPWSRIEGCYADRLASCRLALGLDGRADPVTQWYSPEDRQRLVGAASSDPEVEALRRRCVAQRTDAACREAFLALNSGSLSPPLGAYSRTSLMQLALSMGGHSAYDRLMASRDRPIADRLALAAQVPSDSLVLAWRRRVMAAQPVTALLTASSAWMSVGWCLILGFLALRSSRWR
ncbi:MAG TPA: hypothetical protein VMH88_11125 [Gemmatimonadales bacterium]|nr:hypothetical protein [Gemmatimonadales bacterium]